MLKSSYDFGKVWHNFGPFVIVLESFFEFQFGPHEDVTLTLSC